MNKSLLLDPGSTTVERIALADDPIKRDGIRAHGGEGKVYAPTDRQGCVAKIYVKVDDQARRRKIESMLQHKPRHAESEQNGVVIPLLAWPTHIVLEEVGAFAGFLMPRVPSDFVSLASWQWTLQKPPKQNPGEPLGEADHSLPSRVSGCRNLARLVQSVNEQGYWVIDLSPQNIFVQRQHMRVCLIDCDSFSIAVDGKVVHAATAAREEIRAPEFQSSAKQPVTFTSDSQDRFALAVMIFRWLNRNLHPYQGFLQIDTESATLASNIAARRFAYGLLPHPEIMPTEGSEHESFPLELRRLFDRAFAPGCDPQTRPSAKEWVETLQRLKTDKRFSPCALHPKDMSHVHFTGQHCPRCQRAELRSAQGDTGPSATLHSMSGVRTASMPSSGATGAIPLDLSCSVSPSLPSKSATYRPTAGKGWSTRRKLFFTAVVLALALTGYVYNQTGLWVWQGGIQTLLDAPPI